MSCEVAALPFQAQKTLNFTMNNSEASKLFFILGAPISFSPNMHNIFDRIFHKIQNNRDFTLEEH